MTEQHVVRPGTGTSVLLGVFLGVLLGLATGVIPVTMLIIGPALLMILGAIVLARPVRYDRLAAFGGVLIGAGAFYAYGVVNTVLACVGTTDFCGQADVIPLTVMAASALAAGGALARFAAARQGAIEDA